MPGSSLVLPTHPCWSMHACSWASGPGPARGEVRALAAAPERHSVAGSEQAGPAAAAAAAPSPPSSSIGPCRAHKGSPSPAGRRAHLLVRVDGVSGARRVGQRGPQLVPEGVVLGGQLQRPPEQNRTKGGQEGGSGWGGLEKVSKCPCACWRALQPTPPPPAQTPFTPEGAYCFVVLAAQVIHHPQRRVHVAVLGVRSGSSLKQRRLVESRVRGAGVVWGSRCGGVNFGFGFCHRLAEAAAALALPARRPTPSHATHPTTHYASLFTPSPHPPPPPATHHVACGLAVILHRWHCRCRCGMLGVSLHPLPQIA